MTYNENVSPKGKPLVWLHGELKTPPLGKEAPLEAGFLLRRLQRGELLSMPQSRPLPSIGGDVMNCGYVMRSLRGGSYTALIRMQL